MLCLIVFECLCSWPLEQVEVQVDSVDKAGNFIGWLFIQDTNLSVELVEVSLKLNFSALLSTVILF